MLFIQVSRIDSIYRLMSKKSIFLILLVQSLVLDFFLTDLEIFHVFSSLLVTSPAEILRQRYLL